MWRGESCAAWCRLSLRWRQRFKWGWCEWEQNSLNWDRNAIRRGKIGAGGQRATFTQYWFCSLSLKVQELVTEANEWRLSVSRSGCLFLQWRRHKVLFFSSSISCLLSGAPPLISPDRKDYDVITSKGHDVTLIERRGRLSSAGASKHTF